MARKTGFWISLAVFQLVFGLTIFAATRHYYLQESVDGGDAASTPQATAAARSERIPDSDLVKFATAASGQLAGNDPAALARQANEFFANNQFDRAAELYEQLVEVSPGNVEAYNNLGLTLHYVGRSDEALRRLNEGIEIDPAHQRIWLTLGFVSAQTGAIEQARAALTKAVQLDPDNDVGRSASEMLAKLP